MVDGHRVHALAHRLVWRVFFGPIPERLVINHINGNKSDNRPENLETVTPSENTIHAFRIGLRDQYGQINPAAILTNAQVEEIRCLYATGEYKQVDLANRYGVAFQTISKIVRGERRGKQGGQIDSTDHREVFSSRDPETGRFMRGGNDE
jgi:hypothetical protein